VKKIIRSTTAIRSTALCALALLSTITPWSLAADRYISDVIYVSLRSDKSMDSSVLHKGLPSGTKLEFIREETGADNKLWSLVVTPDGAEGWMRSMNLTDKPTAGVQLANMPSSTRDLLSLQTENASLKQQLEKVQQDYQQLLTDTEDMRQAATTAVNLEEESQRIHAQYQLLQTRADVLNAENEQLKKTDRYNQWVFGGLLIGAGVILSFILQAMGRRKRQSEWR
jgi:SH3 domain protein